MKDMEIILLLLLTKCPPGLAPAASKAIPRMRVMETLLERGRAAMERRTEDFKLYTTFFASTRIYTKSHRNSQPHPGYQQMRAFKYN